MMKFPPPPFIFSPIGERVRVSGMNGRDLRDFSQHRKADAARKLLSYAAKKIRRAKRGVFLPTRTI